MSETIVGMDLGATNSVTVAEGTVLEVYRPVKVKAAAVSEFPEVTYHE